MEDEWVLVDAVWPDPSLAAGVAGGRRLSAELLFESPCQLKEAIPPKVVCLSGDSQYPKTGEWKSLKVNPSSRKSRQPWGAILKLLVESI